MYNNIKCLENDFVTLHMLVYVIIILLHNILHNTINL